MTEKLYSYPEWDYGSKKPLLAGDSEKKGSWYNVSRKITRPGEYGGTENSFSVRAEHAEYYKKIVEIRKAIRTENNSENKNNLRNQYKNVVEEMRLFDDLGWQFQNERHSVEVDMGEMGIQSALAVTLIPKNIDPTKRPLVIVPGISSNIEGVGSFPMKVAIKSKQAVTIIGHPESWMGKVTPEFNQAVKNSENFTPHTTFFEKAINQMIGSETTFDLCGISAGCVLTGEITNNDQFNQRIGKINLIAPPGLADMTKLTNIGRAFLKGINDIHYDPRYTTSILDSVKETEEQRELKIDTYKAIRGHLSKKYSWWDNPNLYENRKVKVILGKGDGVTLGGVYGPKVLDQDRFDVSLLETGYHGTFAREPEKVIEKMVL